MDKKLKAIIKQGMEATNILIEGADRKMAEGKTYEAMCHIMQASSFLRRLGDYAFDLVAREEKKKRKKRNRK